MLKNNLTTHKICFLIPSFYKTKGGGAELQVNFIIDRLIKIPSFKIFYICSFYKESDSVNGIKIFHIKSNSLFRRYRLWFTDFFSILFYLNKIKPDIIYCRVGVAYIGMAAFYKKFINKKTKLVFHIALQTDVEKFKIKNNRWIMIDYIDKKFFEYGIRNADYIIGQAKYQNRLLKKNFNRTCYTIIPNFHPSPNKQSAKELPLKILWVANLNPLKQPEIFIKLTEDILFSNPKVKFIMVGRAGNNNWSLNIIKKISSGTNLKYLGELSLYEVNNLFSAAHIFINTSSLEGFPNTFIQSMMRNTVIVSLNVDPDNILKDNKIGFHSRNYEQLKNDVQLLISDDKLRNEVTKRAYEYVIKNHSLVNIDKIIDLFYRIIINE